MGDIVIIDVKPRQGPIGVFGGPGSVALTSGTRVATDLSFFHLKNQFVYFFPDWNKDDWWKLRQMPGGVHLLRPKRTPPSCPHGFRGDVRHSEQSEADWGPELEGYWRRIRRISDANGAIIGLTIHVAGAGGHLRPVVRSIELAKHYLSQAQHWLIFLLPTKEITLWKNLRRQKYLGFPDDLGLDGIVVVDNANALKVDNAIQGFITTIVTSGITRRGQRTIIETLAHLSNVCPVHTMAVATQDIPTVKGNLFQELARWFYNKPPVIAGQVVRPEVARLVASLLEPASRLLDFTEPDGRLYQAGAIQGIPIPLLGQVSRQQKQRFEEDVKGLVEQGLEEKNLKLPEGLKLTWSSVSTSLPDRYTRIVATRIVPLPGKRARDFIDTMLATDPLLQVKNGTDGGN